MNKYIKYFLPYGLIQFQNKIKLSQKKEFYNQKIIELNRNAQLYNKHEGDRCFLIATGSSINNQNLKLLKNEILFSLSRFYYHKDYMFLKPKYQISSGYKMHKIAESIAEAFFKEFSEKCISENIFFDYMDKEYVSKNNKISSSERTFYYSANLPFSYLLDNKIDLTKSICAYQNIFILSIQIAIYMGFKEIYLLGADHDWILKYYSNESIYFYENNNLSKNEDSVNDSWKKHENIFPILESYYKKWQHYISLKNYAEANHIKIYNATDGGMLDVFQRVSFQDIKFK